MSIQKVYNHMVKELCKASAAYYNGSNLIMTDAEYDLLLSELHAIEASGYVTVSSVSPTLSVGSPPARDKIMLKHQMRSLKKVSIDALPPGYTKVSYKYDGIAAEIFLDSRGRLKHAATRGDGCTGVDITEAIRDIIQNTPEQGGWQHFRGIQVQVHHMEIYITQQELIKINQLRASRQLPEYADVRSAVSGILLSSTVKDYREVIFSHYIYNSYSRYESYDTNPEPGLIDLGYDWAVNFLQNPSTISHIEGLVFEYPCKQLKRVNPKIYMPNRLAVKHATPSYVAQVDFIEISLSDKGKETPVLVLKEPVIVCNRSISRISMHNRLKLHSAGVKAGDKIEFKLSGNIIPQFVKVIGD